ncbi:hypothetical protein [Streptomyces sp. MP131-18]|uniref:GAP1-M domain-containing protein n=1 Tax=Streptomyces sp. MP131-18 TaxID=1857892 RepID=UPI00097C3E18|nr:hypothetical protein [Streptomyces sp. MP131-18]ONK14440.1 hypothetical protein STBA_52250 [Streptomyces sp. MP131-18]
MQSGHVIRRLRFTLSTDEVTERVTAAADGTGRLPEHLPPLVAAAAPAPPVRGGGCLAHAGLPGGGSLLLCRGAADGTVDALYLPHGPERALGDILPVDLWRSPLWDRPHEPDAAPAPEPEPGTELTAEELADFARARSDRLVPFLSDVRALFTSPAGRQLVLAEEEQATVARWIGLATWFLDRYGTAGQARALTFTTGTACPLDAPQQIIGIGPDAAFDRKDPDVLRHRYRVHDGLGGEGSPPRVDPWVTQAVRDWLPRLPGASGPPPPLPPAAPAAVQERLRESAKNLRGGPHHLHGVGLFRMLRGRLGESEELNEKTLRLIYELVWDKSDPDLAGALELARTCPLPLLVSTGIHLRLLNWITRGGTVNDKRCELARELLRHEDAYPFTSSGRETARLLVRGQELNAGGPGAADAEQHLRRELNRSDSMVRPEVLIWARRQLRQYEESTALPPPPPPRTAPPPPPPRQPPPFRAPPAQPPPPQPPPPVRRPPHIPPTDRT